MMATNWIDPIADPAPEPERPDHDPEVEHAVDVAFAKIDQTPRAPTWGVMSAGELLDALADEGWTVVNAAEMSTDKEGDEAEIANQRRRIAELEAENGRLTSDLDDARHETLYEDATRYALEVNEAWNALGDLIDGSADECDWPEGTSLADAIRSLSGGGDADTQTGSDGSPTGSDSPPPSSDDMDGAAEAAREAWFGHPPEVPWKVASSQPNWRRVPDAVREHDASAVTEQQDAAAEPSGPPDGSLSWYAAWDALSSEVTDLEAELAERDERIAKVEALVRLVSLNTVPIGRYGISLGWRIVSRNPDITPEQADLIRSVVDEGGENDG